MSATPTQNEKYFSVLGVPFENSSEKISATEMYVRTPADMLLKNSCSIGESDCSARPSRMPAGAKSE